jgi:fructose-bisphosphate aldolase class I
LNFIFESLHEKKMNYNLVLFFGFCLCLGAPTRAFISNSPLGETAQKLVQKGILATDESVMTIGKRFEPFSLPNTKENRDRYRRLLFSTPDLEKYISGAILHQETLENNKLVDQLFEKNIIPGIKLDTGLRPLEGTLGETWCTGLDTLSDRAKRSYQLGARFAKWRAVFKIDEIQGFPSSLAIRENAWGLARYARICQQEGLVPIVEPEILMDGDHSIETTARIQEYVLRSVYDALYQNGVFLESTLLKPSMTTPGIQRKESPEKIAAMTLETLQRSVPLGVPGIMFLSGGASEQDATLQLNALHQIKPPGTWKLSFSYGRGLQHSCLQTWAGRDENIEDAQQILFERAQANFEASRGRYQESNYSKSKEPLFITHYQY